MDHKKVQRELISDPLNIIPSHFRAERIDLTNFNIIFYVCKWFCHKI
jgi:hypothetical protein